MPETGPEPNGKTRETLRALRGGPPTLFRAAPPTRRGRRSLFASPHAEGHSEARGYCEVRQADSHDDAMQGDCSMHGGGIFVFVFARRGGDGLAWLRPQGCSWLQDHSKQPDTSEERQKRKMPTAGELE